MDKELEQLILTATDLPTIPVVAMKVLSLIESEESTAEELARVVSSDPAVAARVLKISNSSFYGCQRKVQTLPHAIMMLGYNTLRSLVVTASVKQVYNPYGLTEKMLWEHSVGAGLAARIIANTTGLVNEEEAFLGGLFHDIGKLILNTMDCQQFQMVMEKSYNEEISFMEAERQTYSYTHADVGGLVIKKWNFPEMLMKAVQEHHSLNFVEGEDPYQITLTAIVGLANFFCHKNGIGIREPETELILHETKPAHLLNLNKFVIESMLANFENIYKQDKSFFE